MKKLLLILLLFLHGAVFGAGGYELSFCTAVDKEGYCNGKSDIFRWTGEKMKMQCLVYNKDGLKTSKLYYKLFLMRNDHDGELAAELTIYTKPEWFYIEKKVYFFKPGYYKMDVYNAGNVLIGSLYITITDRDL